MAFNAFIGWSRQDLETELRRAQEDHAAGKTIVSSNSGDVGKTEALSSSPVQRIRQLLIALNRLAPDDYPFADVSPTNRTRAVFD